MIDSNSSKTNHAPRSSPFEGGPWTHFQPDGNVKTISDLHAEHRWTILEWSSFGFAVLVLRRWQTTHWGLVPNPIGRAPTCVHRKVVVLLCWNCTISVCAPMAWWSRRNRSIFGRSKTKWLSPQSITNLCVLEGWKFACEKHNIFSKFPLKKQRSSYL